MPVEGSFGRETLLEDLVEITIAGQIQQLPKAVAEGILKRRSEITARRERFATVPPKNSAKRVRRRRRRSSGASEAGSWRSVHLSPARGRVRLFG